MSRPDEPARILCRSIKPTHQACPWERRVWSSDCHGCLDGGVRVVPHPTEVLERVAEEVRGHPVDCQGRQRTRFARELRFDLLDVVVVDVHVTTVPGERSHL